MQEHMKSLLSRWRRRHWRADPKQLEAFAGLAPVTVITGASDGIGRAFASRLAAQGHTLLLIARTGPDLEAVAADLRAAHPAATIAVLPLDVTGSHAAALINATLFQLNGYADLLINNAGIGLSGPFAEADEAAVSELLALNVNAATLLARHVLPGMLMRGRGGILFVASLAAYTPGPWQAIYYASKAYLLSLAEALAAETAGHGVRICCIAPGPVETRFHEKMGAEHAFYRHLLPSPSPDRVAALSLRAYRRGFRVFVPGLVPATFAFAICLLPHRVTVPIVSFLLRRRVADTK